MINKVDFSSWKKIEKKLENKLFNLSEQEISLINQLINESFYDFSQFIYRLLNKNNSAIKYSLSDWDCFNKLIYSLNNKLIQNWYNRTLRYRVWGLFSSSNYKSDPSCLAIKSAIRIGLNNKNAEQIRNNLSVAPGYRVDINNVFSVVDYFSPELFSSKEDYIKYVYKNGYKSVSGVESASKLIPYSDKTLQNAMADKIKNALLKRVVNHNNKKIILRALQETWIVDKIKQDKNPLIVSRINRFLAKSNFKDLDNNNFQLVKNLIDINNLISPELTDDFILTLQEHYLNLIYKRRTGQKGSNKKKMWNFLSTIPGSSPKKALYQLAEMKKIGDVEFLTKKFPELSKLLLLV